jgi:PEP-CTERM motif
MNQLKLVFAAVASLVAVGAAQAATGDAAYSSGLLSNLTYQVRDLKLSDGINATVMFGDPPGATSTNNFGVTMNSGDISLAGYTNSSHAYVRGVLFTSGDGAMSQLDGYATASKTGTTFYADAGITSEQARSVLNVPLQGLDLAQSWKLPHLVRWAQVLENGGVGGTAGLRFVLAPHSSITFSADATGLATTDLSGLIGSEAAALATALHTSLNATAYATVLLSIQYPWDSQPDETIDGLSYTSLRASSFQSLDAQGQLHFGSDAYSSVRKNLSVMFTNNTDLAQERVLWYGVMTDVGVRMGNVPEPATVALMSLGLVGLAAASQRRRQPA